MMYDHVMENDKQVPKVVRVAISDELIERINEVRHQERRNMTNMVEVLLIEALDARDRGTGLRDSATAVVTPAATWGTA